MSNYYGINRSDEYLQHWGIPKGGQRKNHKYLMRVKSGSGWRYLYTPAEVAAYGKERVSGAIKSLDKKLTSYSIVRRVKSMFGDQAASNSFKRRALKGGESNDTARDRSKRQSTSRGQHYVRVGDRLIDESGTTTYTNSGRTTQISNGSKRDPGRRARNQTPKQSKANANSESTRSFAGSLKTGKAGVPSKSNGASGAGNNRRSQKKITYKQSEGKYSTQTNATHTKVKVAKKPLSKVPVLGRVPLLKDISFGKETVDKYLLGNRQTSNKTTKRKASKKARYYK